MHIIVLVLLTAAVIFGLVACARTPLSGVFLALAVALLAAAFLGKEIVA